MNEALLGQDRWSMRCWQWVSFFFVAVLTGIVYYPALFHMPRADHLLYLAEMAGKTDWFTLAIRSYDFTRSRSFAPGDDILFRPVALFLLGSEKAFFGYRFWMWQLAGVVLHLAVIWQLLKILLHLRKGLAAVLVAAFFSVQLSNFDLVSWHHIHSIMLGLLMVMISLFQAYRYSCCGQRQTWRLIVVFFCMLVACFTYELFNIYSGVFFLFFLYAARQERRQRWWALLLVLPAVLYLTVSLTHLKISGARVLPGATILPRSGLWETSWHSGLSAAWWIYEGLFPTQYQIVFKYGRAVLAEPDILLRPLVLTAWPVWLGLGAAGTFLLALLSGGVRDTIGPNRRAFLVLTGALSGLFPVVIGFYRVNGRGVRFALGESLYYPYVFWLFLLIFLYALVDFKRLAGRRYGRGLRLLGAAMLTGLILVNGQLVWQMNLGLAKDQAETRKLVLGLESLIQTFGDEPGFSFYVDPEFPGNYPVPNHLRQGDPWNKRYSFIELLYLDRFNFQTPRFVFADMGDGPKMIRTNW